MNILPDAPKRSVDAWTRGLIDLSLLIAKSKSKLTRRPYWQVLYKDGTIVSEWDRDWSHLKRKGLKAVRLVCPNGDLAELGNSVDASDRLFQLKVGVMVAGVGRATVAQIVGIITGLNGECVCASWEDHNQRLVYFEDNVFDMKYENIGKLAFDPMGIKPD